MHAPDWELIRTFLEVMRAGSLSAAARSMGIAQPTVRRRVTRLESNLGAVLFTRSINGLEPTQTAGRLVPFAETMEATARSLGRAVSDADAMSGTVRVAASELIGVLVLPRILADVQRRHPGLSIELVASNTVADLTRRDADIAVRMASLQGESLVARRIGTSQLGFWAHPSYLERRGSPETLEALKQHDLVGYDTNPQLIDGVAELGLELTARDFRFRTDHDLAYLEAIRAGQGIGVAHAALAAGLMRVLHPLSMPIPTWLVTHADLRDVMRIRAVLDALARGLGEWLTDTPECSRPVQAQESP